MMQIMTREDVTVLAERIAQLPVDAQDELARAIDEIGRRHGGVYELSDAESRAIEVGLAQADCGEFASNEEVDAVLGKPWI